MLSELMHRGRSASRGGPAGRRPANAAAEAGGVPNALTIDLEDWFQVSNLEHLIPFDAWGECTPHIVENTYRLLDLLDAADTRATFFVLGWNAHHFPQLVQDIADAGHEIGSHGYAHRRIYHQSQEELAADLDLAVKATAEAAGVRPRVYRAPSFSVTPRSAWALEVIEAAGFEVDSSVFPVLHDRYGFPVAPRLPSRVRLNGSARLLEAPPSTVRLAGRNIPFSGGAYFRLLPHALVEQLCHRLQHRGEPLVFYFHPWELDPTIPHYKLSPFRAMLSYTNLSKTGGRLARLLRSFRFGTVSEMVGQLPVAQEWDPAASADSAVQVADYPGGAGVAVGKSRPTAHDA